MVATAEPTWTIVVVVSHHQAAAVSTNFRDAVKGSDRDGLAAFVPKRFSNKAIRCAGRPDRAQVRLTARTVAVRQREDVAHVPLRQRLIVGVEGRRRPGNPGQPAPALVRIRR